MFLPYHLTFNGYRWTVPFMSSTQAIRRLLANFPASYTQIASSNCHVFLMKLQLYFGVPQKKFPQIGLKIPSSQEHVMSKPILVVTRPIHL